MLTVAEMLDTLKTYSTICDMHLISVDEPSKDYFPAEIMLEAIEVINMLKSQVDELLPYLRREMEIAVKIGPAEEGHDDNCEDCLWYQDMMLMQKRYDAGEFTH